MGRINSKRLAFLAELDNPTKKQCKGDIRKYIDRFLLREYSNIIKQICWNFNVVKKGGLSAYDLLNDRILDLYSDQTLSFNNQNECDKYMEVELNPKRFILTVNYNITHTDF